MGLICFGFFGVNGDKLFVFKRQVLSQSLRRGEIYPALWAGQACDRGRDRNHRGVLQGFRGECLISKVRLFPEVLYVRSVRNVVFFAFQFVSFLPNALFQLIDRIRYTMRGA